MNHAVLYCTLQNTVQLMGADTFLGRAHEMHRLEHLMQRNPSVFENRPYLYGELLGAVAALMKTEADALLRVRFDLADAIHRAAVTAHRAFLRPQGTL